MQKEPLKITIGAIRICEVCNMAARVLIVVFGSYLLTMGKVNIFCDLEMELKIFLGQMLVNVFVNYKSKYFFLLLYIFYYFSAKFGT